MYIYLNVCKQMTNVKLWLLYRNTWNHLTVGQKVSSGSFKNVINKMYLWILCWIYMYKEDLALNNLQRLICHKTKLMMKDIFWGYKGHGSWYSDVMYCFNLCVFWKLDRWMYDVVWFENLYFSSLNRFIMLCKPWKTLWEN